jgi:hypothetical protein
MKTKDRIDAELRGCERMLALSEKESYVMQEEIIRGMEYRGHEPTQDNLLFTIGAPTDEEWEAALKRMREFFS